MNEQSEHIVQDVRTKMHIVVASILISLCVTLFIYLMPADDVVKKMAPGGSSRAPAEELVQSQQSAPQQPSQYWVLLGAPLLLYIGKKTTDLVFDDVIKPILIKKLSR